MAYGARRYRRGYTRRSYWRSLRRSRRVRGYASRRRTYARRTGRSTTKSSVVKLSYETDWTTGTAGSGATQTTWNAFSFYPAQATGFAEYGSVYSHFRLIKAVLRVNKGGNFHYLVVPSRTFAATVGPFSSNSTQTVRDLVPPATETALRQTKFQKELYPTTIREYIRVGFKPYTVVGTTGPTLGSGAPIDYYRVWEGRRWMPMSWATPLGGSSNQPAFFWGPYMAISQTSDADPPQFGVSLTVTLYCQFKGQK
uniref:Capsid protein n=1 Tax=Otus scops CRESS-DNA-virus sp. TaxID=2815048 RepID=A0A8A4XC43_9VIRU|nr:MAG: capsid protein [Otus scops CRESS-DNA-virus sp.]